MLQCMQGTVVQRVVKQANINKKNTFVGRTGLCHGPVGLVFDTWAVEDVLTYFHLNEQNMSFDPGHPNLCT